MDFEARWKFAQWLKRRYGHTIRRLHDAESILEACGVAEAVLAAEWTAQVAAQLVKLPRWFSAGPCVERS